MEGKFMEAGETEESWLYRLYASEISQSGEMRLQMDDDEAVVDGEVWNGVPIDGSRTRSQVKFNIVRRNIQLLTGLWTQSAGEAKVMPARGGDGPEGDIARADATIKNLIMRKHENACSANFNIRQAVMQAASCGIAFLHDYPKQIINEDGKMMMLFEKAHVDWRFCVWDTGFRRPDMQDARYFFERHWLDLDVAKEMFPKAVQEIEDAKTSFDPRRAVMGDFESGYDGHSGRRRDYLTDDDIYGIYHSADRGNFRWRGYTGAGGRIGVWVTRAWWRGFTREGAAIRRRVYYRDFVSSAGGFVGLMPKKAEWMFLPFTPIIYSRDPATGFPRGLASDLKEPARQINAAWSQMMDAAESKRVVMSESAVSQLYYGDSSIPATERIQRIKESMTGQFEFLVVPDGMEESVKIDNNSDSYRMAGDLANMLLGVLHNTVNTLNPATLGTPGNAKSGIAIQSQQMQGITSVADFMKNANLAVKCSGEKMLSLIEWRGEMDEYYSADDFLRGQRIIDPKQILQEAGYEGSDGEYSLSSNRAQYTVSSMPMSGPGNEGVIAALQKAGENLGDMYPLFLPIIIRLMPNIPQAKQYSEMIAAMLMKKGFPISPDMVSQEEAKTMEEQDAQNQQQQAMLQQIEQAMSQATIDKTTAEAELARARAAKESDSTPLKMHEISARRDAEGEKNAVASMGANAAAGSAADVESLVMENDDLRRQLAAMGRMNPAPPPAG